MGKAGLKNAGSLIVLWLVYPEGRLIAAPFLLI
jgi:hypothetical protein